MLVSPPAQMVHSISTDKPEITPTLFALQYCQDTRQKRAATEKNSDCGGMYIPGVRIVKYWNQGAGKPLRSYHAEAILWHALSGSVEYPEAVVRFFDEAYERLSPSAATPDPGAPEAEPVDQRLEPEERATARDRVEKARRLAHEAFEKEKLAEALEGWVKVFGSSFPGPSTSPEEIGASLGAGTAGVAGAGVQTGHSRQVIQPRSWRRH